MRRANPVTRFVGGQLLDCARWAVLLGLVLAGYFGAAAISAGIQCAHRGYVPHVPTMAGEADR